RQGRSMGTGRARSGRARAAGEGAIARAGLRRLIGCAAVGRAARKTWWVVVIGVLVFAGCDAPTRPEHTTRLTSLHSTAIVQADGTVSMNAVLQYPNDGGGS